MMHNSKHKINIVQTINIVELISGINRKCHCDKIKNFISLTMQTFFEKGETSVN